MDKKIIFISGRAEVGKATAIKKIYDDFIKEIANRSLVFDKLLYEEFDGVDFKAILKISSDSKNITIAFNNQDDPASLLEKSKRYNCDIILLASRSRGKTTKLISSFADENGYEIEKFEVHANDKFVSDEHKAKILGILKGALDYSL